MKNKDIFDYTNYREYLVMRFGGQGKRTGLRLAAANAINCHTTYISQVLSDKVNLSLEQASKLNHFLQHSELESHFFLLLLQWARAGNKDLEQYFRKQIEQIQMERKKVSQRVVPSDTISKEDAAKFYSSWTYQAVQTLLTIPACQSVDSLANKLQLPKNKIIEVLNFLIRLKLVQVSNNRYQTTSNYLHLSGDSENIFKHHTNWRIKSIQSLDSDNYQNDLHYSAVVTLSEKDVLQIKESILKKLEANLQTIKKSKPETGYVYSLDFFRL